MSVRAGILAILIAVVIVACGDGETPATPGPNITSIAAVEVDESDDFYIARPRYMSITPNGRFVITDSFLNRVVIVDRDGTILRTIGQQGEGPGELEGASVNLPLSDTTVAVYDYRDGTIALFDLSTGEFKRELTLAPRISDAIQGSQGVIWLGALDSNALTGVQRWDGDVFSGLVGWPESYRQSNALAGVFAGVSVEFADDTLLALFSGSDRLILSSKTGSEIAAFEIPNTRRRGVPEDVVERLASAEAPAMTLLSSARDVHRLPNGDFAILHFDLDFEAGTLQTSGAFVTIVDRSLQQVCVDGVVPVRGVRLPIPTFRGDTLFLLHQHVDTTAVRAETRIQPFLIDSSGCSWMELERLP